MHDFFVQLEPALISLLSAVLTALGGVVAYRINKWFGAKTSETVTRIWNMGVEAAAGYLAQRLAATGEDPAKLTEDHPLVHEAADYMRESFPDAIDRVKPKPGEIVGDILAKLPGILGVIGTGIQAVAAAKKGK